MGGTYRSINHVALQVPDLRAAEEFYRKLFGLKVAFREAELADGWATLPEGAGWEDAEAAGIKLGLSGLSRDAFTLALEAQDDVTPGGQLSHIGLEVDEEELDRLRSQATALGCEIVFDNPSTVIIDDPYGVRWEVTTAWELASTGARTGRWLKV